MQNSNTGIGNFGAEDIMWTQLKERKMIAKYIQNQLRTDEEEDVEGDLFTRSRSTKRRIPQLPGTTTMRIFLCWKFYLWEPLNRGGWGDRKDAAQIHGHHFLYCTCYGDKSQMRKS